MFYLWLYDVRDMVKDHSDSERGNLLRPQRLLFPISSKGSFICIIPHTGGWGGGAQYFFINIFVTITFFCNNKKIIHTYIHTYIHTQIHTTYIHTYIHTYVRTYVHTCIHTHTMLAWQTSNCGRIAAIGSSPSNGLKPNF